MARRLLLLAGLGALVVAAFAMPASANNGRGAFVDDDGSVHESDINGIWVAGITAGCNPPTNDRYCPTRSVTRAEMAAFLNRALDLPSAASSSFTDITGHVHAADIRAIAAADITVGCNPPANTRFCPDQPLTRAQMASLLRRALDLPSATSSSFTDIAASVHAADIRAIAAADITVGCNPPANTNYCPNQAVTRAQMASFLVRALDDVTARRNTLSLQSGIGCTKDGLSCTRRLTLARGILLEVREGWYQVMPYLPGEASAFTATGTRVAFTWNGQPADAAFLGLDESSSPATRLWRIRPERLTQGTHTLRATWQWAGSTTYTVTALITVP